MIKIYALLAATVIGLQLRLEKRHEERGLGTLEMVVIGLGLLVLATGAVAVFTSAINTREAQIK